LSSQNRNFIVSVRKRPLNIDTYGDTKSNYEDDIITTTQSTISVHESKQKVNLDYYESIRTFKFDHVFSDSANNLMLYRALLKKRIENLRNVICYTFGETGSGKTHTLFGKSLSITREFGLIEACLYDLLKKTKFAEITAFEIYNNKLYDLIMGDSRAVDMYEKAGEVHVVGLGVFGCTADNVAKFINIVMENRRIGTSSENDRSSRSHVVIKIVSNGANLIFVDVAGCERGNYIRIAQDIQNEMININRDNFALKECMRSILHNKQHNRIPFRLSKITMALKESFYDNYDTVVITTINPKKTNISTTLNILSYVNDFKMYSKPPKPVPLKAEPIILPPICEKPLVREQQVPHPPNSARSRSVTPSRPKRIVKSASANQIKSREIIKELVKLSEEEKNIYVNYLNKKENGVRSLPDLYGEKLGNIKLDQIDLLGQLGLFDQKNKKVK
jgi:kinesin family protein 2/24